MHWQKGIRETSTAMVATLHAANLVMIVSAYTTTITRMTFWVVYEKLGVKNRASQS